MTPSRFTPIPADEWVAQAADKTLLWLLEGVLLPKGLTVVGGQEKMGKSFLVSTMALALTTGTPLGPFIPALGRQRVVYFDQEGNELLSAGRLAGLCSGYKIDLATLHDCFGIVFKPQPKLTILDPGTATDIIETLKDFKATVFILDTYATTFEGNEDKKQEVQPYLNAIDRICHATGAACILVHHVSRQSIYQGQPVQMNPFGLRGSTALAAASDVVLTLQEGFVESAFKQVVVMGGKYVEKQYCRYSLQAFMPDGVTLPDKSKNELGSVFRLRFGEWISPLGYFEPPPKNSQPKFNDGSMKDKAKGGW